MSYILSNHRNNIDSSKGQHFLKFDPTTFTAHPSAWIKKTTGYYGHLGLTFGRDESLLYAFSFFNDLSTITLLDTDGNSKWQYSTSDGDFEEGNLI